MTCEVVIQNPCRYPEAGVRRWRGWLAELVTAVAPQARSWTLRFASEREVRRLNRDYRGRDSATDVLSFPEAFSEGVEADPADVKAFGEGQADPPEEPFLLAGHLGDVVVCVPIARRQAVEFGHSVESELRVLILHGLLHCLGYDHETDDGEMERIEAKLGRRWIAEVQPLTSRTPRAVSDG